MIKQIESLLSNITQVEDYNKQYSNIYKKFHKYWSRKPWYIVEKYITKYSEEGDTVLDLFCGSGSTGLEAILNNRNFIGYELNPIAVKIANGTMRTDVDINQLKHEFRVIEEACKDNIMKLYKINGQCPKCSCELLYLKDISLGPKFEGNISGDVVCLNCSKNRKIESIKIENELLERILQEEEMLEIENWYPTREFPTQFYKDRFSYKGILRVCDMHTKRNLYSLALILNCIRSNNFEYKDILLLAFTNTLLHTSKLKGKNVRPLGVNNYWVPDDYIEENAWLRFEDRFENIVKSKEILNKRIMDNNCSIGMYNIKNISALSANEDGIDYIFTDPPYGETIQYSELSYMWNSWLDETYDIEEEVIINPKQQKGSNEFNTLLESALTKAYELLNDGKYLTLCFQNKEYKIWENVINICHNLGFILEDISIFDTFGHPYNKSWAKFSPKSDIYVTFKKDNINTNQVTADNTNQITIDDIINNVMNYVSRNTIEVDTIKLYDVVISLIIWNMYYNRDSLNIGNFDTKTFKEKVDLWYQNNNFEE